MHALTVRRRRGRHGRRGRELHDQYLILICRFVLRKHLMILSAFAFSISRYPQDYQKGDTTIVDANLR